LYVSKILWGGQAAIPDNYQDITGRKEAEEALKKSEEFLNNIIEKNSQCPVGLG